MIVETFDRAPSDSLGTTLLRMRRAAVAVCGLLSGNGPEPAARKGQ